MNWEFIPLAIGFIIGLAVIVRNQLRLEREWNKLICPNCGRIRVCVGKPDKGVSLNDAIAISKRRVEAKK